MERRDFLKLGGAAALATMMAPSTAPSVALAAEAPRSAGWFDVKDFGATGDGITDDTGAIRAAIDAAHGAGGGVVRFPAGVYVTATLRLHGSITLQGVGWTTVLKLKAATNGNLIESPTQQNYYGVVRDLCLDGNAAENTAGNVLNLFAASYYRVEGVKIINAPKHGIAFSGNATQQTIAPWVVNTMIAKCGGNGIDVSGFTADCKIHAVDIGWCDKGVILPNSSFLSDVTIWQCNTGLYGYWAANAHLHQVRVERCKYNGFRFDGCTDLSIEQCRAYENNQSGGTNHGFLLTGTSTKPSVRISFTGCTAGLTGSKYEKQSMGFTDNGSAYVDYVLVQGCTALGNKQGGYRLTGKNDVLGANMG